MARNNNANLDYVHPTPITAWQLIGTAIGVFVVMVVAAWTIITNEANNNREIVNNLRDHYVTKSNHDDLVNRLVREVGRVDELARDYHPRREFEAWKKERDKAVDLMKADIERLRQDTVSRREFDGVLGERGRQIDAIRSHAAGKEEMAAHAATDAERVMGLRREIDSLRASLDNLRQLIPREEAPPRSPTRP